ncbi:hypothetical protein D3218_03075 [Aureimonas flava]|uniref:DUF3971 domain-containing protein n=1 Tax=Aureimonas flava TaxID=2320271 RepID=A0A3A1WRV3_9HYPH|nr:hypothetical protein [Aureimonas flava]RIY03736.1 hypothetical protein D3218_03075 [Aureimonas flava]
MGRIRRLVGAVLGLLLFLVVLVAGAAAFLLATDTGERFVQSQTQAALSRLLGPRYEASLGRQQLELRRDGTLALNWYDAALHRKDRPDRESRVDRVSVALRLMPLVGGSLEFGRLEIAGADLDLAAFAGNAPRAPRDSAAAADGRSVLARTIDNGVAALERQLQALQAFHFDTLSLQDIRVVGLPDAAKPWSDLVVRRVELHRALDGTLRLVSNVEAGAIPLLLSGTAEFDPATSRLTRLGAHSGRIDLGAVAPPADEADEQDERPFGSDSETWFDLSLDRARPDEPAVVRASAHLGAGHLQLGLNRTRVESGRLDATYRQGDERLVIEPSPFRFRDVAFDLSGSVEQTNRDAPDEAPVYGFKVAAPAIRSAVGRDAASEGSPMSADLELEGSFTPRARQLELRSASLRTDGGTLEGSAGYDGSAPDARSFLNLGATSISAASVKAFWPFNIAGKARRWVLDHLASEGHVPSGTIAIDIRRDRIGEAFKIGGSPSDTELRLDVPVRGVALATVGDLPGLRQMDGLLTVRGIRTDIAVEKGAVDGFDKIAIEPSHLVLQRPPEGNPRDLGIELDMQASGEIAQLMAVADREPIHAFRNVPLAIDPFKGRASAKVGATLVLGDDIPRDRQVTSWSVEAELDGIDPGQAIEGRRFSDLHGLFHAIPGQASGSLDGSMDGIPAKMTFALPFGANPVGARSLEADLKVPSAKVVDLVPALDGVVKGTIAARITDDADGMHARLDLGQTQLDLPAVAWRKGAGIAAELSFALRRDGDTTELRDLDLKGDGFRASGTIAVDKRGLRRASLSRVALNPGDAVAVDVERHGDGFGIQVQGDRFDARPILAEIKAGLGRDKKGRVGGGTFDVTMDVGRLDGFNGRAVDGFSLNYASADGRMAALALGGSINGASLAGDLAPQKDQRRIRIAAGDVGGLLGFAGLYGHMEGGQGTLAVIGSADAGYAGDLKLTNFTLVDEPRLSRIVGSSPTPGAASLSQAIGQDLRTERAFFDHASAKLAYGKGSLRVADGIVRGPIFGSSFAGVVYDPSGQIDVSGSFMPAYGINRVFGAIPLLGQILGNGQEGGLIGITYRLSGAMASPSLVVNPISAIAPGIFRQIFAFD